MRDIMKFWMQVIMISGVSAMKWTLIRIQIQAEDKFKEAAEAYAF